MNIRCLLLACSILSLSACVANPSKPSTAPLVNQCPALALSDLSLPSPSLPSARADEAFAQCLADQALFIPIIAAYVAQRDCLLTLQKKGILRAVPAK